MRDRVIALRADDRSVHDIAAVLTAEGIPVSAQTMWAILHAEGIERLERRRPAGPAPRLETPGSTPLTTTSTTSTTLPAITTPTTIVPGVTHPMT